MALRILPFRQYNEHNVVNLYALDKDVALGVDFNASSGGDAGVLVSIKSGDFDKGIDYSQTYQTNSQDYLGKTNYPHIGRNGYPMVTGMTIEPTKAAVEASGQGDQAIEAAPYIPFGITLRQTATHDENGEKLLYYRQKAIENQCVLPGEVVPVLTAGLVTLASTAFTNLTASSAVGSKVCQITANGSNNVDIGKLAIGGTGTKVGTLLAVGKRSPGDNPDQFAGAADTPYALVKIEL